MKLSLEDLRNSQVYNFDADQVVLGRDKMIADIHVPDESVSNQHVRISWNGASWFLEDLRSSNGTSLNGQLVSQPVAIRAGDVFGLGQFQFKVVFADGLEQNTLGSPPAAPLPPFAMNADGAEDVGSISVGYFMLAVPKAFAYYLLAVPLLIFNPLGTLRKSAAEQPLKAKGSFELMAYAIPAYMFTLGLGSLFAFISSLIAGSFSISILIPGLPINLAIGVVMGIVFGLIFHPFTKWMVTKLGGSSTAKSRTNYAINFFTISIIVAIPSGIDALLTATGLPFIVLLGPLLMLVATGIMLFFLHTWFGEFGLVKWIRTVVLVLGALAVLGAVGNLVNLTIQSFKSFSSSSTASGDSSEDELSDEQEQAIKTMKANGVPSDQIESARKAYLQANKTTAQSKSGSETKSEDDEDSSKKAKAAATKQVKAKAAATKQGKAKAAATKQKTRDDDESAGKTARDSDDDAPDDTAEPESDASDKTSKPDSNRAAAPPVGTIQRPNRAPRKTPYLEFVSRKDEIGAAIKSNPQLIKKPHIRALYSSLLKSSFEITMQSRKLRRKAKGWQYYILDRERDLKIFRANRKRIDKLYSMVFAR